MFVSERQQTKPSRDIKCSCITVVIGYNSSTVLLQLVSLVSATAAAFDVIHSYSYDSFIFTEFSDDASGIRNSRISPSSFKFADQGFEAQQQKSKHPFTLSNSVCVRDTCLIPKGTNERLKSHRLNFPPKVDLDTF